MRSNNAKATEGRGRIVILSVYQQIHKSVVSDGLGHTGTGLSLEFCIRSSVVKSTQVILKVKV